MVIILEMVTCPKSAGQERYGAEAKHIIKQLGFTAKRAQETDAEHDF